MGIEEQFRFNFGNTPPGSEAPKSGEEKMDEETRRKLQYYGLLRKQREKEKRGDKNTENGSTPK